MSFLVLRSGVGRGGQSGQDLGVVLGEHFVGFEASNVDLIHRLGRGLRGHAVDEFGEGKLDRRTRDWDVHGGKYSRQADGQEVLSVTMSNNKPLFKVVLDTRDWP